MEGITTYTYRNTHDELFGGCDAYYAPFIVPTDNERLSVKNLRDIITENNSVKPKIQVMCSTHTAFGEFVKKVKKLDYEEVNINLGCPSGTVVKKYRGSGALRNPEALDEMLFHIFSDNDIKVSIKTRTGFYTHDEFDGLLKIYEKYPVSELIVHPRIRDEFYKGVPNLESFKKAYDIFGEKLCYNGNIYTISDYDAISDKFPNINSVMIGRGGIKNPAIFREIKGGHKLTTAELINFSNLLEKRYYELYHSERNTLHKLKEIWIYAIENYPNEVKIMKAVKKSQNLTELNNAINSLPEL